MDVANESCASVEVFDWYFRLDTPGSFCYSTEPKSMSGTVVGVKPHQKYFGTPPNAAGLLP